MVVGSRPSVYTPGPSPREPRTGLTAHLQTAIGGRPTQSRECKAGIFAIPVEGGPDGTVIMQSRCDEYDGPTCARGETLIGARGATPAELVSGQLANLGQQR